MIQKSSLSGIEMRPKFNINSNRFISEEFLFFILKTFPEIFPHFFIVSYFPFAPRHGKKKLKHTQLKIN